MYLLYPLFYALRSFTLIDNFNVVVIIEGRTPTLIFSGLDLGAGAIIGIIISIFFVLLVIFIVILARIKGRWCFSGKFLHKFISASGHSVGHALS